MKTHKSIFVTMALIVLSQFVIHTNAKAVTIFIDGMNTYNTLFNITESRTPYLINSPLAEELKQKDSKQKNIPWSGNILNKKKMDATVEYIKEKIIGYKVVDKNVPIHIVAHSFGAVLAYDALKDLEIENGDIQINTFTTMGSPLGKQPDGLFKSVIEKMGMDTEEIKSGVAMSTPAAILKLKMADNKFSEEVIGAALKEIVFSGPVEPLSKVNKWTNMWAEFDNISGIIGLDNDNLMITNIQIDKAAVELCNTLFPDTRVDGTMRNEKGKIEKVSDFRSAQIWHRAYYQPIENIEIIKTGEVVNWNIPHDYLMDIIPSKHRGYKLADLRENAIKASKEAEKSIFRRTIEEFPELAKDVFSIPTAKAAKISYGESDPWKNGTTVSQIQNTIGVENDPPWNMSGRPASHWGHMAGMLTKDVAGTRYFEGGYGTENLSNLDSFNIRMVSSAARVMTLDGTYSSPKITASDTSTGIVTGGIPVSIDMYELGYNSFLEWGYWLQNNLMQAGAANYYFDNRGYYVRGDYTTNAQMQDLAARNISGTYNGKAYATYWIAPGGYQNKVNMSGNFTADVNFPSKTLNNINLSVSGNSHSASISGATASFIGGSSQFVGKKDGQWKIDGVTAGSSSTKNLRGSVYGPNSKAVGGTYGMDTWPNTTGLVTGVFQGTR